MIKYVYIKILIKFSWVDFFLLSHSKGFKLHTKHIFKENYKLQKSLVFIEMVEIIIILLILILHCFG